MTDEKGMVPKDPGRDSFAPLANARGSSIAKAESEGKHEIQAAFLMAIQRPRDETEAQTMMIRECSRFSFAEDALYKFPRGNTDIEGPSIQMARMIARCWGNLRWGMEIVSDDAVSRTIRVWAWDMETNSRGSAEDTFPKKIYRKATGWKALNFEGGADDERSLRELTLRKKSLLLRGILLDMVPGDIVDKCVLQVKSTMGAGPEAQDIQERASNMVAAFDKIGISRERLEKRIKTKVTDITVNQINELKMVFTSINDGQGNAAEYFPQEKPAEPEPAPVTKQDLMGALDSLIMHSDFTSSDILAEIEKVTGETLMLSECPTDVLEKVLSIFEDGTDAPRTD